jgi:hypothetical protein
MKLKECIETDVLDELHGVLKVLFGLTGETDDEIRRQADIRSDRRSLRMVDLYSKRYGRVSSPPARGRSPPAPADAGGRPARDLRIGLISASENSTGCEVV